MVLAEDKAVGQPLPAALNEERHEINRIAALFGTNLTQEQIQDIVAAMFVEGTGIDIAYDDTAGTITVTVTGGGGSTDPEVVRDTMAAALVQGTNISIVVNDAANTITISCSAPVNPTPSTGDEGKVVQVNSTHTGYQVSASRKANAGYPTSGGVDCAPYGLTKEYNPLEPSYGLTKDQMSGWRLAQARARAGKGLANAYMLGDSGAAGFYGKNTAKPNDPGNAWPLVSKDVLLASGLPWGGMGFVSPSANLLSTDAGDKADPRISFGNPADWDCHKYGLYATSTVSGATITWTAEEAGSTDVYIVVDNAKPAANYTVKDSSGAVIAGPTSTAPTGASSLKMIHLSGLVDVKTVTMTTLGTPTNFVYPVCINKLSGFMMHNLSFVAAIGSGSSGWENTGNVYNGANKIAQLCAASLAMDLLMIQLGGNDEFNAYAYSVITTGIGNLFAQFTSPSKIFIMHGQAASWSDAFMATSTLNYWQMCEDNVLGMIDENAISGGYTKMLNAGIMEDTTGGQTHPNQAIGFLMGYFVAVLLGGMPSKESIQDIIANSLVQGSNVTISYDDTTGKITINASGGGGGVGFTAAPAWTPSHAYTAGDFARLPTGGIGYRTASSTSAATWTAAERRAWTYIAGGHYELDRTVGASSWECPPGIYNLLKCKLKGSGGAGGGAGSAAAAQLQAGGGGGGASAPFEFSAVVVPGTVYVSSIGAAKTGGAGGAAGGNNGTVGPNGDDTTIVIAGVTYTSKGGSGGGRSTASSTAAAGGGAYGFGAALTQAFGALYPGYGGAGATGAVPLGEMIGGGGGTSATATLGGLGGGARTAPGAAVATIAGNNGTSAGTAGANATEDGCGGGGGGGGAAGTGAGGAGGNSGQGRAEYWF